MRKFWFGQTFVAFDEWTKVVQRHGSSLVRINVERSERLVEYGGGESLPLWFTSSSETGGRLAELANQALRRVAF